MNPKKYLSIFKIKKISLKIIKIIKNILELKRTKYYHWKIIHHRKLIARKKILIIYIGHYLTRIAPIMKVIIILIIHLQISYLILKEEIQKIKKNKI
jgi:hypothetical protein